MLSKKMLMLAAVMVLGSMSMPAQMILEDLPLAIRAAQRLQDAPDTVLPESQVQLLTAIQGAGIVAFAVSPDDGKGPLSAENTILLGLRDALPGSVVDWFGDVPKSLAGMSFRVRAVQLDKYGRFHVSPEAILHVARSDRSEDRDGR